MLPYPHIRMHCEFVLHLNTDFPNIHPVNKALSCYHNKHLVRKPVPEWLFSIESHLTQLYIRTNIYCCSLMLSCWVFTWLPTGLRLLCWNLFPCESRSADTRPYTGAEC